MHKTCELRAALMSIPDELAARMPLSYVHFTHFLVDSLLLLAPFALYPKTGFFSVFVTGVGGGGSFVAPPSPLLCLFPH